jgi:membrane-associated phospholipid phosphatase
MIVLMPIGVIAKDAVARPRPIIPKSDFLIAADSEFAFPSGHALIVSAGATVAVIQQYTKKACNINSSDCRGGSCMYI